MKIRNFSICCYNIMFCISIGIKQPSAQVQTSNKVLNVMENKNAQILSVLICAGRNFPLKSKLTLYLFVCFLFLVSFFKKITVWQTLPIEFPICLISKNLKVCTLATKTQSLIQCSFFPRAQSYKKLIF